MKNTFKQDNKAKRVVLAGLFKELKVFIKKGKSGDVPLAETVSWQALHRRCSDFAEPSSLKIFLPSMKTVGHGYTRPIKKVSLLYMALLRSYSYSLQIRYSAHRPGLNNAKTK